MELEAENAKLREEIEAAKHDLSLFSSELVASKLENAKLRQENQSIGMAAYELGRKSMADENATLERRIDELCIDNQRLLEEVMFLEAALEGMHIINDRYRADHAMLTEFAEDAYSFAYNCYHGVCEQETFLRLRAKRNELRELEIEVQA